MKPDQLGSLNKQEKLWDDRKKQGMLRSGPQWVTPQEFERRKTTCSELLNKAFALVKVKNDKAARRLLEQASRTDPDDVRADYLLGILNSGISPIARDLPRARKHFQAGLKRQPTHISLLNNLGILDVQCGNSQDALTHWTSAALLAPSTPELRHNLGKLIADARSGVLRIPEKSIEEASELYAALETDPDSPSRSVKAKGWLYMPLYLENDIDSKTGISKPSGGTIFLNSGTGFVVAEGLICTNLHVIADAIDVEIADPNTSGTNWPAEVVATSPEDDLAILRCDQIQSSPLPFKEDERPSRGTEILAMGFPLTSSLGSSLKSTKGVICGTIDSPDRLLIDAMLNPGNSGGPSCDQNGAVVGVNVSVLNTNAPGIASPLGFSIPMDKVAMLARQVQPDFKPAVPEIAKSDWAEIDTRVNKSIVLIRVGVVRSEYEIQTQGASIWEDFTCSACGGDGKQRCPNRQCQGGIILIPRKVQVAVIDGERFYEDRFFEQRCPACEGMRGIPCRACGGTGNLK